MNETTAKGLQDTLAMQCARLHRFLQESSVQLRCGDDISGIHALVSSVSELEKLVESDQSLPHPGVDLQRLLPAVRKLLFYIKNKDMAGLADLMEDVLCPMADEWMKGSDGK